MHTEKDDIGTILLENKEDDIIVVMSSSDDDLLPPIKKLTRKRNLIQVEEASSSETQGYKNGEESQEETELTRKPNNKRIRLDDIPEEEQLMGLEANWSGVYFVGNTV